MIPDAWPDDITYMVWCGQREHALRVWKDPARWRFEMDPSPCGAPYAVIDALAGDPERLCRTVRSTARWLLNEGFGPHEAVAWAATGVADPRRSQNIIYGLGPGQRWQHWIQVNVVMRGHARLAGDYPYLVLDEMREWTARGWPPDQAANEFSHNGLRRPRVAYTPPASTPEPPGHQPRRTAAR